MRRSLAVLCNRAANCSDEGSSTSTTCSAPPAESGTIASCALTGGSSNTDASVATRSWPSVACATGALPKRASTPSPPATANVEPAGAAEAARTNAAASAWARASDWERSPVGSTLATVHVISSRSRTLPAAAHARSTSSPTFWASAGSMLTAWRSPARFAWVRARAMAGDDVEAPAKRTYAGSGGADAGPSSAPGAVADASPRSNRSSASSMSSFHSSGWDRFQPKKPQRSRVRPGARSQAADAASTTRKPSPHAGSTHASPRLPRARQPASANRPAASAHDSGASGPSSGVR